jgi:membrane protein implicated in regulation of membrane protease activity
VLTHFLDTPQGSLVLAGAASFVVAVVVWRALVLAVALVLWCAYVGRRIVTRVPRPDDEATSIDPPAASTRTRCDASPT